MFAPNPVPITDAAYRAYAAQVQQVADRFDITLPTEPIEEDDHFGAKIDLLLSDPVPVVSFTFGLPDEPVVQALQRAGTTVIQTVTSPEEARLAAAAGVDMLAVQAAAAGGHSGTLRPDRMPADIGLDQLIRQVRDAVSLPVLAAGGLSLAEDIRDILGAGAEAAVVGTALLLADESGASATHQRALTDPSHPETVLTRAFTGRPARGLRNHFIDAYEAAAPLGYPAVHHLTSPLRKAAAAAGEPGLVHLWAGTGYRNTETGPTATILSRLAAKA